MERGADIALWRAGVFRAADMGCAFAPCRRVLSLSQYRPTEHRTGELVSAPVRATAISINLFCIHCFGDAFSPQIIGAISDHTNLSIGLGATLVTLLLSCVILVVGARYAPELDQRVSEPAS